MQKNQLLMFLIIRSYVCWTRTTLMRASLSMWKLKVSKVDVLSGLDISIRSLELFLEQYSWYLQKPSRLLITIRWSRWVHGARERVFGRMDFVIECICNRIRYLCKISLLTIEHTFNVWRLSAMLLWHYLAIICRLNEFGRVTRLSDMGIYD